MPLLRLQDITGRDVKKVGGKAASLGELLRAKHRIPSGFVVTADTQNMSPQLVTDMYDLFDKLALVRVAVRSSGAMEDGKNQSWAGQFATFLHIERKGLIESIQSCWDSALTTRVAAYGKASDLAVLVQQMVDSEMSGVAFSVNPVTRNKNEIMIEAVYGLCEPLVQGLATPDNYLVDKQNNKVIQQEIVKKDTRLAYKNSKVVPVKVEAKKQNQPALTSTQLTEVATLALAIETHYGFPVDIEWAYENDKLYLLQARPITTL